MEIRDVRRKDTVFIREFHALSEHRLADLKDIASADAGKGTDGKHLACLFPKRKAAGIDIGIFMLKGDNLFVSRLLLFHHMDGRRHTHDLGKTELNDMPYK